MKELGKGGEFYHRSVSVVTKKEKALNFHKSISNELYTQILG